MTTGSFALHCTRLYRLNSKKRLEYVAGEKYEAADGRGERGYRRSLRHSDSDLGFYRGNSKMTKFQIFQKFWA